MITWILACFWITGHCDCAWHRRRGARSNLFCYTGAATVHAALGGATTSTGVDLSNTYLTWLGENLALNGLSDRQHRVERADCLEWLRGCGRKYDLVLLDPPSFSNSKATEGTLDILRDHVVLIDAAMAVLSDDGTLYFSNNHRRFQLRRSWSAAIAWRTSGQRPFLRISAGAPTFTIAGVSGTPAANGTPAALALP